MRLLGRGVVARVARADRQPAKAQAAQDVAEAALGQTHPEASIRRDASASRDRAAARRRPAASKSIRMISTALDISFAPRITPS